MILINTKIDPVVDNNEAAVQLRNPPADHKLLTFKHPTFQALEGDFHDFVARAGFTVVIKHSSNKVKGVGSTWIHYGFTMAELSALDVYPGRIREPLRLQREAFTDEQKDFIPKAALGGLTPFQAMMELLDKEKISYEVLWDNTQPNKPLGLFWSVEWSATEWKLNPWV
ncbi:hypothetical protein B0T25DRAFT_574727 [Lasiosphaeria hispida]|uniref:Uncharacterized protein n=1 Tax=Lasiosphaeria hispida TaxID=260671 RepID=A0AAJ0M7S3_9PEZI|nr:hypothetical protein B0T25DRAFT_574727 [Lasiosphaeria hispida]